MTDYSSLLRALVLAEVTRYQKETGATLPRWRSKLLGYVDKGYFVTFGSIPKLGVNPVNVYQTPTGIYGYLLESGKVSTFATERPYAIVYKAKPGVRVVDVQEYTEEDYNADLDKLSQIYDKFIVSHYKRQALYAANHSDVPAGLLWYVTRGIASKLAETKMASLGPAPVVKTPGDEDYEPEDVPWGRRVEVAVRNEWPRVFAALGYKGVVDPGYGVIHDNEPAQAVFWESNSLEIVEVIEKGNEKWTPEYGKYYAEKEGLERQNIPSMLKPFVAGIKAGLLDGVEWPVSVPFRNKALKNLTIKDSKFLPKSVSGCTFENLTITNSYFGSTDGRVDKTNYVGIAFVGGKEARFPLPNYLDSSKINNFQCEAANIRTKLSKCTVRQLAADCERPNKNIQDILMFFECLVNDVSLQNAVGLRLDIASTDAKNISVTNSKVEAVKIAGSIVKNATFDGCDIGRFVVSDTSELENVDLTGSTLRTITISESATIKNVSLTRKQANIMAFVSPYGRPLELTTEERMELLSRFNVIGVDKSTGEG